MRHMTVQVLHYERFVPRGVDAAWDSTAATVQGTPPGHWLNQWMSVQFKPGMCLCRFHTMSASCAELMMQRAWGR